MITVNLDGKNVKDKEELHAFLKDQLKLPEWYGGNLDALFDCLTCELTEHVVIFLRNKELFPAQLGNYGSRFLQVLSDAEEESPLLTISMVS